MNFSINSESDLLLRDQSRIYDDKYTPFSRNVQSIEVSFGCKRAAKDTLALFSFVTSFPLAYFGCQFAYGYDDSKIHHTPLTGVGVTMLVLGECLLLASIAYLFHRCIVPLCPNRQQGFDYR